MCTIQAAFHLAEWCIANREKLHGKTVLELGAGVGLTGLTLINFCKVKMYYFVDYHSIVLKTLEENLRLNLLNSGSSKMWREILFSNRLQFVKDNTEFTTKVEIVSLSWEDINVHNAEQMKANLAIAADILYDKTCFETLTNALKTLLSTSVDYVILAATVRNESTILEFLKVLGTIPFQQSINFVKIIKLLHILFYR